MSSICCVYTCKNPAKHSFPKDLELRNQWIKALRLDVNTRTGRQLKKYSSICSAHFKPSDFLPPVFVGESRTTILKEKSVPSIFPWTVAQNKARSFYKLPSSILQLEQNLNRTPQVDEMKDDLLIKLPLKTYARAPRITFVEELPFMSSEPTEEENPLQLNTEEEENPLQIEDYLECKIEEPSVDDTSTSYDENVSMDINNYQAEFGEVTVESCNGGGSTEPSLGLQSDNHTQGVEVAVQTCDVNYEAPAFTSQIYKNNPTAIHFYTGLENYEKVSLVFHSLGRNVNKLKYFYSTVPQKIDVFEQFFMTLMILRRHKTFEEVSIMYLISIKQVSNIFITWVRFMSLQWRKLNLWLDKSTIKAYMPVDFRKKYPNTRVVIDAIECPIQKPGLSTTQQVTFSADKTRHTIKALIGIAPGGLITYVSPCYGGCATDTQIIERSDILQQLEYNDEIMLDKGLIGQAFFKKGDEMGLKSLRQTRRVASDTYIGKVIIQMKTYKILTEPMNRTETLLSSDIMFICAMLVNFKSDFLNKTA